ncbi:RdgB/HAM1 family non-canonical purine NTP pyrophosphatase [Planktomarina sp.]|uniref:RdgB/HAM1 family non-canonical purine NTP pyrophosphatase n=1 Tax=Planktomarina sp. TaxID=2024851 RepID=UPI00288F43B6|nr:RdgB/HAM1 family non-canonical purine NTP pyrophosphatase [Planktomarina sp.]
MRVLTEPKIVLASHNEGKLHEIQALLAPFSIACVSAGELGLEEPAETETSFAGNARLKAHFAAQAAGLPALSDDSGICVDGLYGAPGVYTADWAETPSGRNFTMAMTRVWKELDAADAPSPRRAQFNCTLCLAWPDGHDEIFAGIATGQVVWPMRGMHGFGFDPMFQPDGFDQTFAEMLPEEKHPLSHRADAFNKLVSGCLT